jgi:hypothetical protein
MRLFVLNAAIGGLIAAAPAAEAPPNCGTTPKG